MSAIKQILTRCVLDRAFLDRLESDPDGALQGYDLSDRQRQILTTRDGRMLELLGQAHDEDVPGDIGPAGASAGGARESSQSQRSDGFESGVPGLSGPRPVPMKPAQLAVRLVPYASRVGEDPGSEIRLTYATHVDPLPDHGAMGDLPPPPVQPQYGQQLPTLAVRIAVQPYALPHDGGQVISFDVEATPAVAVAAGVSHGASGSSSPSRAALVEAVRSASSSDRMARLLDLIEDLHRAPAAGEAAE